MCNIYEATQPVIKTSKLFEKNNHILPIPVSNAQYSARNECELVGLNKKKYGNQLPPPQILGQVSPSVPMFFSNLNNNSNTINHFNPDSRNLFSINISQQQQSQPQYNQYQQHVPLQRLPTTPITPISQHQIQNSISVNNSLYLPNTKQQQQAVPNYSINNSSNTLTGNNMTYKNYMLYSTIQQQQRYISNSLTPNEQAHFSKLAYTKNPNLEQEANSSYRTNNKRIKFNNNNNKNKKNINNHHHHNTLNSKKPHSLNQQNICKVCNKVCQSPSALKIHLAIHSDGKPFKCYFCDKFISKFASNRNRHMKQVHQWDNRKNNSNTSISSSTSRDEGI